MSITPPKPGRFYLIVSIVIFAFGCLLAGVGIYVGFWGTGWGDGFTYLSFGLTAVLAASSMATTRGQMISQQQTEDRILASLGLQAASTTPRKLTPSERLQALFKGTVGGQP